MRGCGNRPHFPDKWAVLCCLALRGPGATQTKRGDAKFWLYVCGLMVLDAVHIFWEGVAFGMALGGRSLWHSAKTTQNVPPDPSFQPSAPQISLQMVQPHLIHVLIYC